MLKPPAGMTLKKACLMLTAFISREVQLEEVFCIHFSSNDDAYMKT